jgi:hypothetical protein
MYRRKLFPMRALWGFLGRPLLRQDRSRDCDQRSNHTLLSDSLEPNSPGLHRGSWNVVPVGHQRGASFRTQEAGKARFTLQRPSGKLARIHALCLGQGPQHSQASLPAFGLGWLRVTQHFQELGDVVWETHGDSEV